MGTFLRDLKVAWWSMLELPWKHSGEKEDRADHWMTWLFGWAWSIAGLVLGALVAGPLLQLLGLPDTPYQDWLVIGVALLAGFLVQLLGWCLTRLHRAASFRSLDAIDYIPDWVPDFVIKPLFRVPFYATYVVALALPLVSVAYGIYRYFTWVGAGEREVTIAFVGALLFKAFAIPLIKRLVTGALFRWFLKWLRGGKDTKNA